MNQIQYIVGGRRVRVAFTRAAFSMAVQLAQFQSVAVLDESGAIAYFI